MSDYPNKGKKFFANKVIRLLQKSCAANDIGIEACWLVTCIALVEDAKHYSGPVTFWTGQLLPITGFLSWGRLDRARDRAIAAGWLFYRAGTNRQSGVYWSMIPESVQKAFTDAPVDEVDHQNGDDEHEVNHHNGDRNVIMRRLKRDNAVNLPVLFPVPIVAEGASLPAAAAATGKTKAGQEYPEQFQAVWNAYPERRRKKKTKAFAAYQLAVSRVAKSRGCSSKDAATWILQRVREFAASYSGQNFPPEPERWFRDDQFDDSSESWAKFDSRAPAAPAVASEAWQAVKQVIRRTDKTQPYTEAIRKQLAPDIFQAAEKVGFRELFGIDQYNEQKLFTTFSGALMETTTTIAGVAPHEFR